jgi:L-ascorbate metabolism protein UlaG (beta-lactamase superfamily)
MNPAQIKFLMLLTLLMPTACASSYKDQRSQSEHFRDGQFHNPKSHAKSFWSFLKMRMSTDYAEWPEWVDSQPGRIEQERVYGAEIHITHINHSTVLIQTEGLNILTDPIYSERCSPVSWAGPKRVRAPGIRFEELPPIDVVLISHDHYDHLDLPTIELLKKKHQPQFYMGLGVGGHLPTTENAIEMDWWQSTDVPNSKIQIHFVPVQHFSGRGLFDRNSTLWGGFVVVTPHRKIYFGGDAGYSPHFKQTRDRLGPMDVSLIPVGSYEPRDFMSYAHVNPEEAVLAHIDLQSQKSIGIHYGTFQLTAEGYEEPQRALKTALLKNKISEDAFVTPEFGQTIKFCPSCKSDKVTKTN